MAYYAYFFTRQDISPEQQIIQTAHAAFKLGVNSQRWDETQLGISPNSQQVMEMIDPNKTNFTVVGVRNIEALYAIIKILNKFEIKYEVFFEPDFSKDGDEITSIAVYPIEDSKRDILLAFNLLRIK